MGDAFTKNRKMRFLCLVFAYSHADVDCRRFTASHQRAFDSIGSGSDFCRGMVAGVMGSCVQVIAGSGDTAFGYAQLKLSDFIADDVSGMGGMGSKVFAGSIVFDLDMVQPALRIADKKGYALLFGSSAGERISVAAHPGIVFPGSKFYS